MSRRGWNIAVGNVMPQRTLSSFGAFLGTGPRTRPIGVTLIAIVYWVFGAFVIGGIYREVSGFSFDGPPAVMATLGAIGLAVEGGLFAAIGLGLWRLKRGALVGAWVLQCLFAFLVVRHVPFAMTTARVQHAPFPWVGMMESMIILVMTGYLFLPGVRKSFAGQTTRPHESR
jgi:hypothetical protein